MPPAASERTSILARSISAAPTPTRAGRISKTAQPCKPATVRALGVGGGYRRGRNAGPQWVASPTFRLLGGPRPDHQHQLLSRHTGCRLLRLGQYPFGGVIQDGFSGYGKTTLELDSGSLDLNGANTYTGGTNIVGGTLFVSNGSALGYGPLPSGRRHAGPQWL